MPAFISNLSVAKRLGLGFALVLLLSLITIIVSIARLSEVAESTREMVVLPFWPSFSSSFPFAYFTKFVFLLS
ncbi:hypothetical protein P3G55_23400 [Leptospira sp. 96542]|nr:hypothetical protein [Leptospira sp. 96542]